MAFDFPASPSEGQEFTPPVAGAPTYVYESPRWKAKGITPGVTVSDTPPANPVQGQLWLESDTGNLFAWWNDGSSAAWVQVSGTTIPSPTTTAEARNRIVNPCFQHSQENGDNPVAIYAYAADQWGWSATASTGATLGTNRYVGPSPNGSNYVLATGSIATSASVGTGDIWAPWTIIEGTRVADFQWGTAQAKQAVLRFWIKGPAGTWGVAITNSTNDRSFVGMYTISAGQANAWTVQTIVIPGDTTGTWPKDNSLCMYINFCFVAGTAYHGVAGWQAGYKFATSAISNGWAAVNIFFIADVGLYLDPLATDLAPAWQMPDEAQELAACMRYYEGSTISVAHVGVYGAHYFKAVKRIQPALSFNQAGFLDINIDAKAFYASGSSTVAIYWSANARM